MPNSVLCMRTVNPLTTNDDYSRHRNSAACYQLAQSVLKIGSALAERVGQGIDNIPSPGLETAHVMLYV